MVIIDRRFFSVRHTMPNWLLTELSKSVHSLSRIEQLGKVAAATMRDALHPVNVTVLHGRRRNRQFRIRTFLWANPRGATNRGDRSTILSLSRNGWAVEPTGQTIRFEGIDIHKVDELPDNSTTAGGPPGRLTIRSTWSCSELDRFCLYQ